MWQVWQIIWCWFYFKITYYDYSWRWKHWVYAKKMLKSFSIVKWALKSVIWKFRIKYGLTELHEISVKLILSSSEHWFFSPVFDIKIDLSHIFSKSFSIYHHWSNWYFKKNFDKSKYCISIISGRLTFRGTRNLRWYSFEVYEKF